MQERLIFAPPRRRHLLLARGEEETFRPAQRAERLRRHVARPLEGGREHRVRLAQLRGDAELDGALGRDEIRLEEERKNFSRMIAQLQIEARSSPIMTILTTM